MDANARGDHGLSVGVLESISTYRQAVTEAMDLPSDRYEAHFAAASAKARHGGLLTTIDNHGATMVAGVLTELSKASRDVTAAGAPPVVVSETLARDRVAQQ